MEKKVLVIDDDLDLQKLIKAILEPSEAIVYLASSGEDGLKQAYMIHPDLVLLDVNMSGMDGFEVCSRMREFSNFPIMMLTARIQEKDLLHGFNVGVVAAILRIAARVTFLAGALAVVVRVAVCAIQSDRIGRA